MKEIQLFIITYNRPSLLVKSLKSALDQDFSSYQVIVSDNSTNNDTQEALSSFKQGSFSYLRREPTLGVFEHLNTVLSEVTSKYFMIFHDDDLMHPNMLSELYKRISIEEEVLAIGSNAQLIKSGLFKNRPILKTTNSPIIINNSNEMAYRYLINRGIVPFPSYLYRKNVSKVVCFDPNKGGKHCDAAFLIDIASIGKIMFYHKPLMDYFIHSGQDSNSNAFFQRNQLINFIVSKTSYCRHSYLIKRFRIMNFYLELSGGNIKFSIKRKWKIIKLIAKFSPLNYFPKLLIQSIAHIR